MKKGVAKEGKERPRVDEDEKDEVRKLH